MGYWPNKMQVLQCLPTALVSTRAAGRDKTLYLTFDDGPNPDYTPRLLDLLAAHGARASFFLVGAHVECYPGLVERMVAEGHRLGNHSFHHRSFGPMSLTEQLREIDDTDRVLARFDGLQRHRFRPPRGVFPPVLAMYFALRKRNLTYWSYNSMDYLRRPPEQLIQQMRARPPRAGDIVLMHDDDDCSANMLKSLLGEWRANGFQFLALPP